MVIPVETKPALWGAVAGAVALAILGFKFGGWATAGQLEVIGAQRAKLAVATALSPLCVDKFNRAAGHVANLAALKKADSWMQGDYIEKGGWATLPGAKDANSDAASICAKTLLGV